MSERTFTQSPDSQPFTAWHDAQRWLTERGFSIGRMQAHEPTGILFGEYDIQKWRNLSRDQRAALDATASGDFRNGPVTVRLTMTARNEARAAFAPEMETQE